MRDDNSFSKRRSETMKLSQNNTGFCLWVSAADTEHWATRPGAAWPCSTLRGKRFRAHYDDNGLAGLTVDGRDASHVDVDATELRACVADHVKGELFHDNVAWRYLSDVVVGPAQVYPASVTVHLCTAEEHAKYGTADLARYVLARRDWSDRQNWSNTTDPHAIGRAQMDLTRRYLVTYGMLPNVGPATADFDIPRLRARLARTLRAAVAERRAMKRRLALLIGKLDARGRYEHALAFAAVAQHADTIRTFGHTLLEALRTNTL